MSLKTLMIGDIVGQSGLRHLFFSLPKLKKIYQPDLIIVNGENTNKGFGILPEEADLMLQQGVDVITSGNHIWQHESLLTHYWQHESRLLRPHNYPSPSPGSGYLILEKKHKKIAVVNLQGRQLMPHIIDAPIETMQKLLKIFHKEHVESIFVDFHAELVSEKETIALAFDGKITALVGTHTHTPTMDEKILPQKTAYISDLGMVGATPSIIGGEISASLRRAISQIPGRAEEIQESTHNILYGVLIESEAGKATHINRVVF
ncbi:TIGR00282 family metallophosphoesterase [Entomospira culicis]|uniref:YmdB family metallophosphoesterase n=1 Tax=Entomospira culicis TaxID=2719989 RepID=A0A968GJG6_9SPIO|nr:TIGR00282 family metallophosphoesterase [Entomospira culicis]NIZ18750.1 YmdB family metallophosphoesterase [Entomospira culicis]NIZ68965.1 YmdB family metallophosphoesterase [Entomospira culicis]WDI37557.1 TIGR00282 family metallophosphoesterase [Entomospira culicis]WDI39185.1 TIGR00282 family metallophosphoesterase [Entomospira culicis]